MTKQDVYSEACQNKVLESANIEMLTKVSFEELLLMIKSNIASDQSIFYCNQAFIYPDGEEIISALKPHMTVGEIIKSYGIFSDGDRNFELEELLCI